MTTSISLQLADTGTYIVCYRYPERTPILAVNIGHTSFSLTLDADQRVTDGHLQAARDLVDAALVFQAEVERIACGAEVVS